MNAKRRRAKGKPRPKPKPNQKARKRDVAYCRACGLAAEPCYAVIRPARCEDCWADDQRRWSGNDQSVALWAATPPGRTTVELVD